MLLGEDDLEVLQRRLVGPELAGQHRFLVGNREHEEVIDRQQRPDQDGDRDQEQLTFVEELLHASGPFDRRFTITKTIGRISGMATMIEAMPRSRLLLRM